MAREQLVKMYEDVAYIFKMSRLTDVRQRARRICMTIEAYLGQLGRQSASDWEL